MLKNLTNFWVSKSEKQKNPTKKILLTFLYICTMIIYMMILKLGIMNGKNGYIITLLLLYTLHYKLSTKFIRQVDNIWI